MANFQEAFKLTMQNEGGYVNDPHDTGGETYKGISRKYNPSWAGWVLIDFFKDLFDFPKILEQKDDLQQEVFNFYKDHYWDAFWGDDFPNDTIARELFDIAVNMGIHRAIEFLQKGLNLLNRDQKLYFDIVEDGKFGKITFETLRKYLAQDSPDYLRKIIVILRGAHYIEYMCKSPEQERFARGWLSRVKF